MRVEQAIAQRQQSNKTAEQISTLLAVLLKTKRGWR
jgi:hypothetical protein